jgi:2-polyprenylphenol hydroxylase and related flavodoxin oxidoreductases
MNKILDKRELNPGTVFMRVEAPYTAAKALPGQFIILRPDSESERIPLTIAGYDRAGGTIDLIFQTVGATTMKLAALEVGDFIADLVGPLGNPSELDVYSSVAIVGGGLGCAIAYPQAKYLADRGCHVDVITGFRTKDLIILEAEMRAVADKLVILTDDGSNGNKGLVTDGLRALIDGGAKYDAVIAIGPPIMMKFVCKLTKEYGIKTIVSLNPIMIDGTGMCGGCRVTVGGKMKFACVDGPDFDGHEVDFDELMRRNSIYREKETHDCNLFKGLK